MRPCVSDGCCCHARQALAQLFKNTDAKVAADHEAKWSLTNLTSLPLEILC